MTGNGFKPTYKNGDDWGMVYEIVFTRLLQLLPYIRLPFIRDGIIID